MEITKIKNVKDFPIVEQSEISELLAYDAEGNLIRAKYDESEVDIDLSDYATKEELAKVQKDATKALDWAEVAQGTADAALADAEKNTETLNGIEDSLNQWKDNVLSGFDGWKTEVETSVNKAKKDAAQALADAAVAQGTADDALDKAETNISEINSIKSTIGDINNILSSL